jgi:hypothetical protein
MKILARLARLTTTALFLAAFPLSAQTGTWTAVASTGALDDSSLSVTAVGTVGIQHQPNFLTAIIARYNVTNTYGGGLDDTPPWNTLDLGYFDNSSLGQVTASLIQVDPCTGTPVTLCSKMSADNGSNCVSCFFTAPMDFSRFNYVVEVVVSRSSTAATPIARTLRLH